MADSEFNEVWHYPISGSQNVVVIVTTANTDRRDPCAGNPGPDEILPARTYTGYIVNADQCLVCEARFINLCDENFSYGNAPQRYTGLLPPKFSVAEKEPNPDKNQTVLSTILHEMIHEIDPYIGVRQRNETSNETRPRTTEKIGYASCASDIDYERGIFPGVAYGLDRTHMLTHKDLSAALEKPANYRLFAHMSFSPDTRWAAP
ncbi:hypothetical protein F5B17DRAFT_143480 [Nemania serpens]|nr:hypothetical protein F5B17DRAFT_143480 [Nemania serpens]